MRTRQLTKNPSLANPSVLRELCTPLESLGINFFGYTAVDTKNNAFCLGSKPEYAAEYLRRNHAKNDVHCHSEITKNNYHFDFWDYLQMNKDTEELYRMAASFNQGHTLTITEPDKAMTHCYHFSGSLTDSKMNQRYLEKMDLLLAFISFFKNCLVMIPELSAVYDLPINIENNKKNQLKNISTVLFDPQQIDFYSAANNRVYFKNFFSYYLNNQERECLKWLRLGKSGTMIAEIKKVSRKTIERYIESIKDKYRCYTMYQLGEKIASSGLDTFLDLKLPNSHQVANSLT